MNRPITTLFMLTSLDGKISTGSTDNLDMDEDLPKINGVSEGLHQYYEIEQTTDLWTMSSGKIQSKLGINERKKQVKKDIYIAIIDNIHLTKEGVKNLCNSFKKVVLVTRNEMHPAFDISKENLDIIYQKELNLKDALIELKSRHNCKRLTVQTGGTVNSLFLREKLLDYIDIIIAPILIGGKNTPTIIDGKSIISPNELSKLGVLSLIECKVLDNSYIRLRYKVN